ncbi:hypothetical protein BROUX41_005485 [Berkeleyomyces rouxiae]|uniref:uncharacterized protein n=1 Tax=Berkeleyomyces rouxiae TaxID=2035830 RepID=UPI003B7797E7
MAGFDYDDFDDGYDSYEDGGGELEYGHVDDHLVYDENGHMISGGDPIIQQIRAELDSRSDEVTDDQIQQALTLNLSDLDKTVEYLFTEFLDRERMNTACSTIMIALGPDASYTTEAKVKESLYYYYYDADKTFEYIARTIKTAKANESKREAEGMSTNDFFSSGEETAKLSLGYGNSSSKSALDLQLQKSQIRALFSDMPWLSVSAERQSAFVPPASLGPVGLLGGSSKLKALAAQRKKQAPKSSAPTDKPVALGASASSSKPTLSTSNTVGHVDAKTTLENSLPVSDNVRAGQNGYSSSTTTLKDTPYPVLERSYNTSADTTTISSTEQLVSRSAAVYKSQDEQSSVQSMPPDGTISGESTTVSSSLTQPSAFAQTLFRLPPGSVNVVPQSYPMPYMASANSVADVFAKPSPDDVVLTAQAQARKFQPSSTTAPGTPSTSDKSAKVPSKPSFNKPQHKNIDVASEYKHRIAHEKNRASFVVTGHVDAGKSTLMGRLLLDLHEVDESLISRFRHEATNMGKQSFALAWVMDQNAEERERGVTVDVTSHTFETDKTHYTILDAPGHRAFVHNAIYGVSQADFAILVLDGNTGAFEKGIKGQTYEHILLLRSLGIQRIVVAINKLDMVNWSQDRYDEIKEQITAFLYKFDFSPNNLQFVPISGLNGDNVVTRPNNDSFSWYQGPTLVEALDRDEPLPRVLDHPMRMMISDLWSTGAGKLTASGRIEIGTVQVGDQLLITPSKESCYVQSILVGHETRDWAVAGENVDFVVVGVEATSINAGDVLSAFDSPLEPKKELVLKALAFQPLYPLSIDLHRGRLQCSGQINKVMAILDRKTGFITNSRATRVDAGEVARISVTVNQELPVEAGQRVVIRSGEHTIAAGVVE